MRRRGRRREGGIREGEKKGVIGREEGLGLGTTWGEDIEGEKTRGGVIG